MTRHCSRSQRHPSATRGQRAASVDTALAAGPILFPQHLLQDLSRAAFGQALDKFGGLGNLEAAEVLAAVTEDLAFRGDVPWAQHNHGFSDLSPSLVRNRNNRALKHRWMVVENALDLGS